MARGLNAQLYPYMNRNTKKMTAIEADLLLSSFERIVILSLMFIR